MSDLIVDEFAAMIRHGLMVQAKAQEEARWARIREANADRLRGMFGHMTRDEVRALWDSFDEETSFCGEFDCADVHGYLNLIGDGKYCAV